MNEQESSDLSLLDNADSDTPIETLTPTPWAPFFVNPRGASTQSNVEDVNPKLLDVSSCSERGAFVENRSGHVAVSHFSSDGHISSRSSYHDLDLTPGSNRAGLLTGVVPVIHRRRQSESCDQLLI